MGVFLNKVDREQLKPGDHIYSWRQLYVYAHHGIYVGDGMVIHFTRGVGQEVGTGTILDRLLVSSVPRHDTSNPCPICGDQSNKEGVISSCLDCFLYGGNLYLFAYGVSPAFFLAQARGGTCTCVPSDPTEDVLHRASILLEHRFGAYDIYKKNCEDFAIYCKTGLLVWSGQAASCSVASNAIFLVAFRKMINPFLLSGLAMVGYGMYSYCANRLASDIGRRHDAFKIPVEGLIASLGLNEPETTAEVPMEHPITSLTTNHGTVDRENLVQRSEYNGSEQLFVGNGTGLRIAHTEAERRKKEETKREAKLAEIAEKQRQREREVEEKERQRREALLGRGTEPASRPSELPTHPPESGSAAAAGPAPGKYAPRYKREKKIRGRKKEEAERLAEIAEKQRQRERELEEKERQKREALLGRGTEPASRPSEPPMRPPESGSTAPVAAASPAPGKYVPRFKRDKSNGPAAPPPETGRWTNKSSKLDGDRWRSDDHRPEFGSGGGSRSSSTWSSSRNHRDR